MELLVVLALTATGDQSEVGFSSVIEVVAGDPLAKTNEGNRHWNLYVLEEIGSLR